MSLKHKNTSKWAKKRQVYAKYDDKAREQIQEQLDLSKKLTKKLKQFEVVESDSDDERDEAIVDDTSRAALEKQRTAAVTAAIEKIKPSLKDNPWMKMMSGVGGQTSENGAEEKEDDGFQIKNLKPLRNEEMLEEDEQAEKREEIEEKKKETPKVNEEKKKEENIDVKSSSKSNQKKKQKENDDEESMVKNEQKSGMAVKFEKKRDDNEHRMTLMEAFADDDIVEEFRTEKV